MSSVSVYEHVGGMAFFRELVDRFYEGVESDPTLRGLYPDDLNPGKEALALFLGQYWGGPSTYSDSKGHPRLRMRHFSFPIGQAEHDAWLTHMGSAVRGSDLDDQTEQRMLDYFAMAAQHLINAE